ncbi:MAG: IS630 family transposase [Candidatus Omnitrophica bacterium]|nr:IS630 family transposase [Candidatus Omnitrophota bacterium]
MEKRRRRAIQLMQHGHNLPEIARAVKASVSSVFRWQLRYRQKGLAGLRPRPAPGRPARLSSSQKQRVVRLLLKGALAAGYSTDLWTLERIGRVIEKQYHVTYHPAHVWKLMHALGWSCQKPERRALQRDEHAIAHWKRYLSSWGRIWRSSTRVASSSFRTLSGPGPRKARRRTRGTSIHRGTSPP